MKLQKISAFAGIFVAAALLTACGTNTPAAPDTNAAAAHRGLMFDWQAEAWVKAVLGLPVPLPF